jgi:two-component system, sensor histidine kinase and response regulator
MSRFIIFTTYLILTLQVTLAQEWQKKVDSLERMLLIEQSDTGKINLYIDLHYALINNEPSKALSYVLEAKDLAETINDTSLIVYLVLRQCDFYNQIGDYTTMIDLAYKALSIAGNDPSLLADCHNRIASAHIGLENARESLYHNRKSLNYNSKTGDSSAIIADIHNIGRTYVDLKMYDSALYYLNLTNNYSYRTTGKPDPYALSNIGIVYGELGKHDSALMYHLEAYKYDSLDYHEFLLGIDEQYIAESYYHLKRYWLAKRFANKSIDRAYKLNATDLAVDNFKILYQVYSKEGNYKRAFDNALKYTATKDSLNERENQALIHGLETKYKVQEQENRLKLLEKQKRLFIILTIVSILFVVSMIIIVILVTRRNMVNKGLMQQLRLANESKERLLSIISHDLRGSVGTLRIAAKTISEGMTNMEDARNLLESFYPVADSTYDLLENLLTWAKCNKEEITPTFSKIDLKEIIDKSIEHTHHLAISKSINVVSEIQSFKLMADKNMLLSVMRNILSNAIKFSHAKGEVVIHAAVKDQYIIVSVTDNGIGIEEEVLQKLFKSPEDIQSPGTMGERGSGLGISICKTFLQSHGGEIWAESTSGTGSTFYFKLPLNQ